MIPPKLNCFSRMSILRRNNWKNAEYAWWTKIKHQNRFVLLVSAKEVWSMFILSAFLNGFEILSSTNFKEDILMRQPRKESHVKYVSKKYSLIFSSHMSQWVAKKSVMPYHFKWEPLLFSYSYCSFQLLSKYTVW